jgi:hypothetical protein
MKTSFAKDMRKLADSYRNENIMKHLNEMNSCINAMASQGEYQNTFFLGVGSIPKYIGPYALEYFEGLGYKCQCERCYIIIDWSQGNGKKRNFACTII